MSRNDLYVLIGFGLIGLILAPLIVPTLPMLPPKPKLEPPIVAKRQLVYFGASWCAPCRQMQKTLADPKVAAALKDLDVVKYDLDHDKDLATKHGVTAVPTYLVLDGGREARRASGYKSPADFLAWLQTQEAP